MVLESRYFSISERVDALLYRCRELFSSMDCADCPQDEEAKKSCTQLLLNELEILFDEVNSFFLEQENSMKLYCIDQDHKAHFNAHVEHHALIVQRTRELIERIERLKTSDILKGLGEIFLTDLRMHFNTLDKDYMGLIA